MNLYFDMVTSNPTHRTQNITWLGLLGLLLTFLTTWYTGISTSGSPVYSFRVSVPMSQFLCHCPQPRQVRRQPHLSIILFTALFRKLHPNRPLNSITIPITSNNTIHHIQVASESSIIEHRVHTTERKPIICKPSLWICTIGSSKCSCSSWHSYRFVYPYCFKTMDCYIVLVWMSSWLLIPTLHIMISDPWRCKKNSLISNLLPFFKFYWWNGLSLAVVAALALLNKQSHGVLLKINFFLFEIRVWGGNSTTANKCNL